jgi:maltose O-acetyltransferase
MKTELEKMLSGEIFDGADHKIDQMRTHASKALSDFNQCSAATQQQSHSNKLWLFFSL